MSAWRFNGSAEYCLQVPDEEDLLKRRIKAEQRKQQAAVALEIKAASTSAATAAALASKSGTSLAGGSVGELKAITLVVRWVTADYVLGCEMMNVCDLVLRKGTAGSDVQKVDHAVCCLPA
jgi:hypothetical protein